MTRSTLGIGPLPALLTGLLVLYASGALASNEWAPLNLGGQWTYAVSQDNEIHFDTGYRPPAQSKRGREISEIIERLDAEDGGEPIYLVEIQRMWMKGDDSSPSKTRIHVSTRGGALLEHGVNEGGDQTTHATPVVNLPSKVEAGLRWNAGATRVMGNVIEMTGLIEGVQDAVTPAGTFTRCLRVRYEGTIQPAPGAGVMDFVFESGTFTQTSWFALGVGEVMSKSSMRATASTPKGVLTSDFLEQRSLTSYRAGDGQPASPAPPAVPGEVPGEALGADESEL